MVADPLVSEHQIMENGNVFEKKKNRETEVSGVEIFFFLTFSYYFTQK